MRRLAGRRAQRKAQRKTGAMKPLENAARFGNAGAGNRVSRAAAPARPHRGAGGPLRNRRQEKRFLRITPPLRGSRQD
ncbi:MAG: hypothetical protein OXU61_12105, partial [Gammaproteobacteria bacterium]|nr:hypothetical protein [Gammaproteobacteria bacterium]